MRHRLAPVLILVLSDLWVPFPGGAERLLFNIARDLHRRGEDVHVLTGYEAAQRFDGPPFTAVDFTTDRDAGGRILAERIAALRPQVILTHHHYAFRFEPELVTSGVPFVQVVLNGYRIPEAALAVYISQWVKETTGGSQPGDLTLTPPAMDDVVAATHGEAIGFIKPLPHKGVELVYRLARRMPRRPFLILRGEWQDLEVIRPRSNITFMEPVEDIRDFYARCRLILVPSCSEDAGTVAQEATRNGLPCLSTAVGGLAETNAGGILLDGGDVRAWLRAIYAMDSPGRYAAAVRSQAAHLDATDHGATLDVLAERVRELAAG